MHALPRFIEIAPAFFRRKRQHRRHQFYHRAQNFIHRRLAGTPRLRGRFRRVHAVFQHVKIQRAHIHDAEIMKRMEKDVEFEIFIRLGHALNQELQAVHRPLINFQHLRLRHGVFRRIEIMQVAEHVAARVANAAVGVGNPFHHVHRNRNIGAIVFRRNPQPQDFRAVLLDNILRRDGIAQ